MFVVGGGGKVKLSPVLFFSKMLSRSHPFSHCRRRDGGEEMGGRDRGSDGEEGIRTKAHNQIIPPLKTPLSKISIYNQNAPPPKATCPPGAL